MENRIQLSHPEGKNAVKIDAGKYEMMKNAITQTLSNQPLTHKEMHEAVNKYFKKNKITFEGSVEWYMESVKLDMEAKKNCKAY
jgi:hypothetical protein